MVYKAEVKHITLPPDAVFLRAEYGALLDGLNKVIKSFYDEKHDWQDIAREVFPKEYSRFILDSPGSQEFFQEFRRVLLDLPEAEARLAFSPGDNFLKKLKEWFVVNGPGPLVLDTAVDPSIAGGIIIGWAGTIIDRSLAKKMEKYD